MCCCKYAWTCKNKTHPPTTRIARFMGPTWGSPGSCRPQMGPILAPWNLLSGNRCGITECPAQTACSCTLYSCKSAMYVRYVNHFLSWFIPISYVQLWLPAHHFTYMSRVGPILSKGPYLTCVSMEGRDLLWDFAPTIGILEPITEPFSCNFHVMKLLALL